MKFFIFFLTLVACTGQGKQNSKNATSINEKCKEIIDSAVVLVQTGSFSINWEPKLRDSERELVISQWFESKAYGELVCLLESKNKLHNIYGYMFAASNHPDSLKNNYNYLFDDTTSVQHNTEKGLVSTNMTVGVLLKKMAETIEEENSHFDKRPDVEAKVVSFISEYASHPSSYKPLGFPRFGTGSDNWSVRSYSLKHEYEIRNNKGQSITVTSEFVLTPAFVIGIIQQDSTSYGLSIPLRLNDNGWFNDYGRKLNHNDSIKLKLK